ncbi:MAG: hypothetical protein ACSNEK_00585 [Parachlamydiaceae bacterium]
MEIAFHPYQLKVKERESVRKGALIRFSFSNSLIGYADCHPWVQFGDHPLEEQISQLLKGRLTPLTKRALHFAKLDALGRLEGRNLIDPQKTIKSHYLILDPMSFHEWDKLAFYEIAKIKLKGSRADQQFLRELSQRAPGLKWRLDFNAQLNYQSFYHFINSVDLSFVDFVEDPFPFDEALWSRVEQEYSIDLAVDFEKNKLKSWLPKVIVIKPAVDDFSYFLSMKSRLIITSYLGHPIEQLCSFYCAQQLAHPETMGIFSHHIYETNDFSNLLDQNPTRIPGTGFGYDSLLEQLEWS